MAATFGSSSTVVGLGSNAVSSPTRISSSLGSGQLGSNPMLASIITKQFNSLAVFICNIYSPIISGFVKSRVAARNPMRQKGAEGGRFMW